MSEALYFNKYKEKRFYKISQTILFEIILFDLAIQRAL